MIEKFCSFLVTKMRRKMPDIDDEKAEVILYGLELVLGEAPKMILLFGLGFLLGIGWYTVFAYIGLMPYRSASGGFHLKSHLGCILGSSLFYYGIIYISKFVLLEGMGKYVFAFVIFVFGMIMVSLYAPADTESVPIISQKERKRKKIQSYITLTLTLSVALFIQDNMISNILLFGVFIQSMMITKIAYQLTNNQYGYEVYQNKIEVIN